MKRVSLESLAYHLNEEEVFLRPSPFFVGEKVKDFAYPKEQKTNLTVIRVNYRLSLII